MIVKSLILFIVAQDTGAKSWTLYQQDQGESSAKFRLLPDIPAPIPAHAAGPI